MGSKADKFPDESGRLRVRQREGTPSNLFRTLRQLLWPATHETARNGFGLGPADSLESSSSAIENCHHNDGNGDALAARLESSARAIVERREGLRTGALCVSAAVSDRNEGGVSFATQFFRFVIGLGWLAIAGWLFFEVSHARSTQDALAFGIQISDATVLMQTFIIVGSFGVGAAILTAALVAYMGGADNANLRACGEELGVTIANESKEFDDALDILRHNMDERRNPADAVIDLSSAHLTALEAQAFFRELGFLTETEHGEAALKFRGFLRSYALITIPPPPPGALVFIFGFLAGAALIYLQYAPPPEATAVPLAIAKYPWAVVALLGGGVLYAVSGLILNAISRSFSSVANDRGIDEALESLRSAFTAREAPRPVDVIRRIEDALEVFRARVGRLSTDGRDANRYAIETEAQDVANPDWRHRDTTAHFIDPGFQAAPKAWRMDPPVKSDVGKTAPKRSLFNLKGDAEK